MTDGGDMGALDHTELATRMADMARALRGTNDEGVRTFTTVVATAANQAVALIPGVDRAAVSIIPVDKRNAEPADLTYATDDIAAELTRVQLESGRGPVADTPREVIITNLGVGDWGALGETAARVGVTSMMTMPLFVGSRRVGVLTAYADAPVVLDDDAIATGAAVATHVALAALSIGEDTSMRTALASRDLIGQAKGMLMERYDIDAAAAFELLARISQQDNRRLVAVAADVVATRSSSAL